MKKVENIGNNIQTQYTNIIEANISIMENLHLHEEQIYLISNHAVARNSIFHNEEIRDRFRDKLIDYLDPVSDILAFNLKDHEFRILLRIRSRSEIENFYVKEKMSENAAYDEYPPTTHIFSRQMSNLQVSLVKHYNHRFNRSGTLMAGRFKRQLIESPEEVEYLVQELEGGSVSHNYAGIWAEMGVKGAKGMSECYVEFHFEGYKKYAEFRGIKIDLVDQFMNSKNLKNYPPPIYCHWQFFRSLCKYHE